MFEGHAQISGGGACKLWHSDSSWGAVWGQEVFEGSAGMIFGSTYEFWHVSLRSGLPMGPRNVWGVC